MSAYPRIVATSRWWQSGGARFCNRCGIELRPDSRPSTKVCGDCVGDPVFGKAVDRRRRASEAPSRPTS